MKYRKREEPLRVHISAVREKAMWRFGVRTMGKALKHNNQSSSSRLSGGFMGKIYPAPASD
jgi:hypothetical protein